MLLHHLRHITPLGCRALSQQRVTRTAEQQTLIDHPRERLDPRTPQVRLQRRRLVHGRGLRKCDQEHFCEDRVPQTLGEKQHFLGLRGAGLPLKLPLESSTCVQQQQRVAGGRRVEHHKPTRASGHLARECAEHGNLLRARRTQVLPQKGGSRLIQIMPVRIHDLPPVSLGLDQWVDLAD